ASAAGGIVEIVDDGRTGLLVQTGNPEALAERICTLVGDRELAARLGRAARHEAHARYSFDRMVRAFERIYLTQLTRRGVVSAQQLRLAASWHVRNRGQTQFRPGQADRSRTSGGDDGRDRTPWSRRRRLLRQRRHRPWPPPPEHHRSRNRRSAARERRRDDLDRVQRRDLQLRGD